MSTLYEDLKSVASKLLSPWSKSTKPSTSGDPFLAESFDFNNPSSLIVRDTGMQSNTLREALAVLSEAAPTLPGLSLFMDKYGFRSLTQNIRDLSDTVRINLLNRAETISTINGMASRALGIRTDLIVSEGFKVEADPDKDCPPEIRQRIQDVLDEHWELNDWQDRTYERVLDLGRTGEMIRRLPPLSTSIAGSSEFRLGRFTCGMIVPQLVYGVSLDPWNYEKIDRIYLEQYAFPNAAQKDLSLKCINDERMAAKEFGSIRGDAFYLAVGRRPGHSRGITDLAPAIDWLDIYEQMLMMDTERAAHMMRFIWDVTVENASPAYLAAYAERLKGSGPKPGTVRVHGNKERWDAISPDLKLSDSKELREDIFVLAWGSMGLPRPWFADGENSNRACHSEDTETLTIDGWKGLDELSEDSVLATVNQETNELEYHKPDKMFVYEHSGPMVHFKNNDFDVLVTPEHKMWAKRSRNEGKNEFYEKIAAEDMLKAGRYTMLLGGTWKGGEDLDFTLPSVPTGIGRAIYPEITVPGDLWAEFLGYVISEGHIRHHKKEPRYYIVTVCQKKPHGVELIRECIRKLNECGFRFHESQKGDGTYVWTTLDKGLNLWLGEHCGMMAKNKKIPDMCWKYTFRRMQILLDALVEGDGSKGSRYEKNRRGCSYYTSSVQLGDDVQRLCCHLGLASKSRVNTKMWAVMILDHKESSIRKSEGQNRKDYKTGIKEVSDYNGRVYCFEVKNHLFITRRAGKTAVSHNSIENMTDPNFAWARTRRRSFTSHLNLEHRYALQVAYEAGRFMDVPVEKLSEWMRIKVTSRDPDRKGYESVGAAWADIANALTVLTSQELIDKQSAADIVRTVLGSYGFEIDPERMKIVNSFDAGNQIDQPIDQSAQEVQPGDGSQGLVAPGNSPAASQLAGSPVTHRESRQSSRTGLGFIRRPSKPKRNGILGSSDPLQAIWNESMASLKESQNNGRRLLRHY